MFTYINMKNFKSFKDVTLNLCQKKNVEKKLAIIFGVNGSGKTTITQAFSLLKKTMETMEIRGMLTNLLEENISPPEDFPFKQEIMLQLLKTRLSENGIESIIKNYKMIDSQENMSIEYQFVIDGNPGSYYLELDDENIVKERLEYKIEQRRGCYFCADNEETEINGKVFETKEFCELIRRQAKMYWGKHSLLSILMYEMTDKSDAFIKSNISKNLMDVMTLLSGVHCKFVGGGNSAPTDNLLDNLQMGYIEKKETDYLNKVEKILDGIFRSIFEDIVKVFYQRTVEGEKINYRLLLRKKIEDKTFDIDFSLESSGTKEILNLVPFFVAGMNGDCVVIDEYGTRIHDVLSAKILEAMERLITGQVIITTHNTMIMESESLDPESLYYIVNDKTYRKTIKCITEIEDRLHPNYNYRTRYLTNGLYIGTLPSKKGRIDFTQLSELDEAD